jgi:hypothetical protein
MAFLSIFRYEAVRYEKAYYSFESLATLQPYGHVDNYLLLIYCWKLFMDHHPKYSKKHTFFSFVGGKYLVLFVSYLFYVGDLRYLISIFDVHVFMEKGNNPKVQ